MHKYLKAIKYGICFFKVFLLLGNLAISQISLEPISKPSQFNKSDTISEFEPVELSIINSPKENDFSFNTKVSNSRNDYSVYFYDGDISIQIGFYFQDTLIKTFETAISPNVHYSYSCEFVEITDIFGDDFYIFNKYGDLIYTASSDTIFEPNRTLYNVFTDGSGNQVLVNVSYNLSLISLQNEQLNWSKDYEYRRARKCIFFKDYIILQFLTPAEKKESKSDKYSLVVISIKTGQLLTTMQNINGFEVVDDRLFIASENDWQQYEIVKN